MPRISIPQLRLELDEALEAPEALRRRLAAAHGLSAEALASLRISRRSLDARGRGAPRFWVTVELELPEGEALPDGARLLPAGDRPPARRVTPPPRPPLIVGSGPAGLFCALELARHGVASIVLERGHPVERRKHEVAALYRRGELDPESNVCFGEGGAGTFTDGKLSTRVRDPAVREVLEALVEHGADPEILVTNKPHLGSERLPAIVKAIREHLEAQGCELRFGARVERLLIEDGAAAGVGLAGGEELRGPHVILAAGGSARELFEHLGALPGVVEPKAFAVGLRVEHPQELIDAGQYGRWAGHPALPPADYKLVTRVGGDRGAYAFCMCPGGVVVPTPTEPGALCVNGMSASRRSSRWANSALVAEVSRADLAAWGHGEDALAGLRFQRVLEQAAFKAGGEDYAAPSSSVRAFLRGRDALAPGRSSYPRGLVPADLAALFPAALGADLRTAVGAFARKMKDFDAAEARLIGVEARTSAPISLPRGADTVSTALPGLHPCGEGCGHAGGIVSAAIDGLRVARSIVSRLAGEPL
ncbi:MAG: FAD-binding protein [Deltaproteobacteria bacterium]|nr:FAD-binding protein [Deltaproteobacteria bacterium]